MKKNVVGIFSSSYQALRAIDSMKQDGIDKSHIHVIANDDYETRVIEEKAGVAIDHTVHMDDDRRGFWDELKSFFSGNSSEHSRYADFLLDMGMNDYDVEQYAIEVENGKILVLVDSEYDLGRTGVLSSDHLFELENRISRKKEYEEEDNPFYKQNAHTQAGHEHLDNVERHEHQK
ncbi:general stress protein [Lederbergia citrea]|uniref:General stress protein n=1 Tax=Lederbergia citrea TaxID=2833581 RepID=A0A942UR91_9BACI|nr:general stress protein [Lederbergia citrea]MBS4222559.1 general stress protein [Lederbergia citrea]